MIKKTLTRAIAVSLSAVMVLQLSACGTIFYPERKGTKSGEIDPVVAVADAIGLLFFFIPGVIAFAVDFNNGTIYKSGKKHSSLTPAELKSVSVNGKVDKKALSVLMSTKFGLAVNLDSSSLQMKKFSSEPELLAHLNAAGLTLANR
ncbi:MAG TPA: polyribonucleotide nucleotidyltransferase [Cellvibrio sp.]|nr:polyribonucleotide nucleotidyltransferase [Cellvibrio sp.]